MDILDLCAVIENERQLEGFMFAGMEKALQEMGKAHYKAAIRVLRDMHISPNPAAQVRLVVTCLHAAYEADHKYAAARHSVLDYLNPFYIQTSLQRKAAYLEAYQTAILIAICYKYLDEREAMAETIQMAYHCLYAYFKKSYKPAWMREAETEHPSLGIYVKVREQKMAEFRMIRDRLTSPLYT
jgi:hypothetical protein